MLLLPAGIKTHRFVAISTDVMNRANFTEIAEVFSKFKCENHREHSDPTSLLFFRFKTGR
jgi:hypothetical protein